MGLLRSYRSTVVHPRDPGIISLFGASRSKSGANVTPATAMGVAAVYRAVRLIARTIATLPIGVYERLENGDRKPAPKHPLHYLLTVRPNKWMTAFGFKEMMAGHVELRGNAFAEIKADGRGRVTDLIPLHPDRISVHSGTLSPEVGETVWYEHTPRTGGKRVILWDEMLHLRGFSQDGLIGLNPIQIARDTLGLAITNQELAQRLTGNDGTPPGIVHAPKQMDVKAKQAFRKSWKEMYGGENRGEFAILDEGMKWESIGLKPIDAQFIQQRQFDIQEIARIFDLPPHKLMDLERSTNNNIEHQGIEYVMDAILPRSVNWEETLERDLFLPSDQGRFYIEANLEGLMRGDSAARAAFYTALFNCGGLTPNDIRRKENMNPVEGGDDAFIQLNMVPLKQAAKMLTAGDTTPPADDPNAARAIALRRRLARMWDGTFTEAFGRALSRELNSARRALEKAQKERSLAPFDSWIEEFYPEHQTVVARSIESVVQTAGAAIMLGILASCRKDPDTTEIPGLTEFLHNAAALAARAHVVTSTSELRRVIKESTAEARAQAITELLEGWEKNRALVDGAKESQQLARQVGEFVYRALGLPTIDPLSEAA